MSAIARWRTHFLTALLLSLTLSLSTMLSASAAGPLVRLSSDPYRNPGSNHRTQVEPDTFTFANTVVSAFQSGRFYDGGASNIGFATSNDGGRTWTHGFLPRSTVFATPAGAYQRASDPSVAYDARHGVWLISWLGFNSPTGRVDVLVSRSTDRGLSWDAPVAVNASGQSNDKNWTVCDDTASSPFYGHCYTEFDDASNINRVQMSTSSDGGITWGPAKTTPDRACVIGGQPLVQPGGTVIVPIDDCFETAVLAFRSTDGGNSWSRVTLAAQILFTLDPGNIRSGALPSAEMDGSGKVYVVWEDCRFEPPNCAANDLVMITSTDGIRWTLPRRIPIDPIGGGVDHFIPGLAVDRATAGASAHLGLAYYYYPSINCTVATCELDVGFISSNNGGATWSPAEQLAGPMRLSWLPLTTLGFMVGDYISTSIVPGDDDATPVFAVASAPTPPPACSNLVTHDPGSGCHEAMFTTPEDLLKIKGGANEPKEAAPAMGSAPSRLSAPARAF
jgi:hypothetical protein